MTVRHQAPKQTPKQTPGQACPVPIRPGVGPAYVERTEVPVGRLDEIANVFYGRTFARFRGLRRRRARRVALAADRLSAQTEALDEAAFAARITDLRLRVVREGLTSGGLRAQGLALLREAARRALGLRPHLSQLIGAAVMLDGALAEMETGEGKTLTALLPAALQAMTRQPVHLVTANDYLAGRDAEFARPFFAALGLTVGAVQGGMPVDERREAYRASVTYGAGKEVAFDYLRDRLVLGAAGHARLRVEALRGRDRRADQLVMRGLGACIVDEADSIMVDEARTPLILTREADGEISADLCAQALEVVRGLGETRDYLIDRRRHRVEITDQGETRLESLTHDFGAEWSSTLHRNDLAVKALSALNLFRRDEHYLVDEDGVKIIDEYTGRTMPDRYWNDGLHQMIEVKEGCAVSGVRMPLVRLTYQRFFRRYRHLAGMSGTLREVAAELWSVYRVGVIDVPTHRPLARKRLASRLFADGTAKWAWIARRAATVAAAGRPVLIGVRTVEAAQDAHAALIAHGLSPRVLSAAQDKGEADVVAAAGAPGAITVATNMAGRGTDIRLGAGVADAGGLHVIIAERHQSRRIDRQLAGRCARQGDPGSYEVCVAIDDDLVQGVARRLPVGAAVPFRWLWQGLGLWMVGRGQAKLERLHGRARARLMRQDQKMEGMLAFAGEET